MPSLPAGSFQMSPRLYLVGAGVSFPEHLTLETLDILGMCTRICSNLPQPDLDRLPKNLKSKAVSLWPLYQENRERSDNYSDIAQVVMDAAKAKPPVAWLTPGHPLIFDSVSQQLLASARAQKWNIRLMPAVSCIDTILADICYDPANGLIIHEAYAVVMRRIPLETSCAALLLQPSAFGTDLTHYSTAWRADLSPLRDYLLEYFPPAHRCAFVRSASLQLGVSRITWSELGGITDVAVDDVAGATLFVPPVLSEER
jgi:hypothetical protein